MSSYQIDAKPIVKVATSLYLSNVTCDLFQNAWYSYILRNEKNEVVETDVITLTPAQYSQWSTDDQYIVNLTCELLGLTLKP